MLSFRAPINLACRPSQFFVFAKPAAQQDDVRDDLAQLSAKYQLRMLPTVVAKYHLLRVIHYHCIVPGLITRSRAQDLNMARIQTAPMFRFALWASRIYLLVLLEVIGL